MTTSTRRRTRRAAVSLSALTVVSGGFGGAFAPTAEATTPETTVTLRIGTNDDADQPMSVPINEFARQVEEVSGGAIRIEPVWNAGPPDTPTIGEYIAWDQFVARRVVSGEIDMGMIPARAWDTEGVTTLRALFAPFLVDSDSLVAEIVDDPELTGDLLAGLDGAGVTGLALLPESLRHLFSFGEPLTSPDDFAGTLIRAPYSATTYALFEALGALGTDLNGDAFAKGIADGSVGGAESAFARAAFLPGDQLTVATGNVTPYPNINTLVINRDAFDALSGDEQTVLRDAAGRTLDALLTGMVGELAAAEEFCAAGGGIVLAGDDELAALETAAQPVLDELMRDNETATLIDRISEIKASSPIPPTVAACERPASEVAGPTTSGNATSESATIPSGTYTRTITRAEAEAIGVDAGFIEEVIGPDDELVNAFEFTDDGRWTQLGDFSGTGVLESGDFGTYRYDDEGRLVTTSESQGCRGCIGVIEWTYADRLLTMELVPYEGFPGPYPPDAMLMTNGEYEQDS